MVFLQELELLGEHDRRESIQSEQGLNHGR